MANVIDAMKVSKAIEAKISPDVKVIMDSVNKYFTELKETPQTTDILAAVLRKLAEFDYVPQADTKKRTYEIMGVLSDATKDMPANKKLYSLFFVAHAIILSSIQTDIKEDKI